MTQERIGNVILDLTRYSGEDLYSDGEVEDRLLQIAQVSPEEEFDRIIRKEKDWPVLYHLSSIRGNIVSWIPFTGREKVLEIGAGPGAITGVLAQRCARVECIELSRKRSYINAYRHSGADNLTIHVGNFEDIEPSLDRDYDYIFLIGVLEYAGSYFTGRDPFREELTRVLSHLRPGGRAVVAIENRLGLKYWAGCAEDHSGRYFDGIESYASGDEPAKTFSRPALESLLRQSGAQEYSFYYPYPDYKFTEVLYSDRRLPYASELSSNIRNFDRERLLLFDEQKAYRGITQDGLYPLFANSFEIVIGPPLPVAYCKFSNDRAPQYRIRTEIGEAEDGSSEVRKYPMTAEAAAHVEHMLEGGRRLSRRYQGRQSMRGELKISEYKPVLHVASCRRTQDGGIAFPFVPGRSLESMLDECLSRGDGERFVQLLEKYRDRVGAGEGESDPPIADYDMTFANILISGDTWTAVDYEWTVDEDLPAREMLFRALLVYYLEDESRRERCDELIGQEKLLQRLGIPAQDVRRLTEEEHSFQEHVTGGVTSLGELRAQMGTGVIKPAQLQTEEEREAVLKTRTLTSVQIYCDTGSGYREEDSWFIDDVYREEGMISFDITVPADAVKLRVDPTLCPCIVLLRDVWLEDEDVTEKANRQLRCGGRRYSNGSMVFTDDDPWIEWKVKDLRRMGRERIPSGEEFTMGLTIQMAGLPSTMAEAMRGEE